MPQQLRSGGNVILKWSPNLENGEALPRPELTRIFSNSRTGRTDWHRNQFVPLPSRPPPEQPPVEYVPPQHRQHLIYLALYRDKVDQHQAAMMNATAKGGVADCPSTEENLAATTGHFPVEGEERRNQSATAHQAAVKATGVGLNEHAEAKRLGKLFDEWVAMQQDVDMVYEKMGLPNREGAARTRQKGAMATWPAPAKMGHKSTKTSKGRPDRFRGKSDEPEPDEATMATATSFATAAYSQACTLSPRRSPDRKKLERLWTVLTNPKVRCASLSDKAGYERDRQMPTRIEGIKPLMLYKLYNGPWRLDV